MIPIILLYRKIPLKSLKVLCTLFDLNFELSFPLFGCHLRRNHFNSVLLFMNVISYHLFFILVSSSYYNGLNDNTGYNYNYDNNALYNGAGYTAGTYNSWRPSLGYNNNNNYNRASSGYYYGQGVNSNAYTGYTNGYTNGYYNNNRYSGYPGVVGLPNSGYSYRNFY